MKIAVIGCGVIAETHLRILRRQHPNSEIVLCDRERDRADTLAGRWSVQRTYGDFTNLLSVEKPETVHITTPPPTHSPLAREALDSGCHVYVEKPAAETAAAFKELLAQAERKQVLFYCGYSTLGMPVVMKLKQQIATDQFGRLISVHCNYGCSWPGNQIPYANPNHWAYRLRGGILQNMIDHPASLIVDLVSPVKHHRVLSASRKVLPFNCPDMLHVAVENDDQMGSFTLSLGHGSADRRAHLLFERGSVVLDISRMLMSSTVGGGPPNFVKKALSGFGEGWGQISGTITNGLQTVRGKLRREPGICNLVADFYSCIAHGSEPLVRNETILAVTTLLESVWGEIKYQPPQNGNIAVQAGAIKEHENPD